MKPERFMDLMNMLPDDLLVSAYKDRFAQHTEEDPVSAACSAPVQPEQDAEISVNHPPRWMTAAALAACVLFAVGIGAGVLHLRRQQEAASPPGIQEASASSMQDDPAVDLSSEDTNAVPDFTPDTDTVPDFTLAEDGTNIFGGHGMIRPVTAEEGEQYIFQDDDYYYFGGSRLLKSAAIGDDVSDLREECPQNGCDMQALIGSGQDMYYVDLTTESAWNGHAGGLKRILPDGTTEDLHPQREIAADDPDSVACRVHYRDVLRLGDSGIYYVNGAYMSSADEQYVDVYPDPVLLNSRTGETVTLHYGGFFSSDIFNQYYAKYDEASGNLFISRYGAADNTIVEVDIHTGTIVQEYAKPEHGVSGGDWFVRDHVLHFLADDPDSLHTVNWYTLDLDTEETQVLLADCHLTFFDYCDGRVYAARHTSLGDDALLSFAPDGTDETLLGEIHSTIIGIQPVFDPDNIVVKADSGAASPILFRQDSGFSKLW